MSVGSILVTSIQAVKDTVGKIAASFMHIDNCISFQLNKAAQRVGRRARELLAPFDVTPSQYGLLSVLAEGNWSTQADLGERLGLDSASITGLLDRTERTGLCQRRADPDDRRLFRVGLTRAGERLMPRLRLAMEGLNREVDTLLGARATALRKSLQHMATPSA